MNLSLLTRLIVSGCLLAAAWSTSFGQSSSAGTSVQQAGTVRGVVVDKVTGEALENAHVSIQGTSRFAITGRGGAYTIYHVPAGHQTLTTYYTGYNTAAQSIQVQPGGEVTAEVRLASGLISSDVVELEAYVVDVRRGQADEIMQRRQAVNVVDVVSTKTLGEMVDGSLGIDRLAGMTGGTGIRGIGGEFNLVRIDGVGMASPGDSSAAGSSRIVDMNQVPGDMIERIEVTKSPRPDMDADAVGGTINLVTRNTLDLSRRRTSYSFGGMYSPSYQIKKMGYVGSFEHSDLLGKSGRIGYALTLNHNRRYANSESLPVSYLTDRAFGVPLGGPAPVETFRAEQSLSVEDRTGVGLKFDLKPVDHLLMQFGTLYQKRKTHTDVADWRVQVRDRVLAWDAAGQFYYAPDRAREGRGNIDGAVPLYDANGNITTYASGRGQGGVLPSYNEYITEMLSARLFRFQNEVRDVYRDTVTLQSSGQYTGIKDTKITFNVGYSWGKTDRQQSPDGGLYLYDYEGTNVRIDRTNNVNFPEVTILGGTDPYNPNARVILTELRMADYVQIEKQLGLSLDAERALATRVPIFLKSGLRLRRTTRDIDVTEYRYNHTGSHTDFVGGASISPFGEYYSDGIPNMKLVRASLANEPGRWTLNMADHIQRRSENDGYLAEGIQGAYFMANVQWNKLALMPGVRTEWTQFRGIGNVRDRAGTDPTAQWENFREQKGSYDNFFPHFHLRYEPWDRFVIRGAWSTGIGRPRWSTIIPIGEIDPATQSITMNNSELRPQYTNNFDLNFEYYTKTSGLISVNFFRKEIDDLIFRTTDTIRPGMGWDSAYEGWMLRTYANAAWAWVRGVEFDARQQFSFLPGWLGGLSVYANLTLLDTAGNYSTPDGSVTSKIPNFVPKVANLGITYSGKRLSVDIRGQFRDEYMSNWDERSTEYWRYTEASSTCDAFVSYGLSKRFRIFCNVSNIFEDSPVQFQARPNQPYRVSQTSRRFDFGIRGSL